MSDVRPAAVAGSWYPAAADRLAREVDGYLATAELDTRRPPIAIIAPHAGLRYSGPVAAFSYKAAAQSRCDAVVLVGPSHFVGFDGVSIWPRGAWDTPFGRLPIAEELATEISSAMRGVIDYRAAHAREHSLEMQTPFLARLFPDVPIVPLVMGYQRRETAFALGNALGQVISGRSTRVAGHVLLVASSDLSHFHDARTASVMDAVVARRVEQLDADGLMGELEREPHHACGGGPIVSVMRAAMQLGASDARVLKYGDSGDVSGDKASVVGYMAAAIW